MQHFKIFRYFFFILFICAISRAAFSKTEISAKIFEINKAEFGISADSIPKSEIADYRKNFEAVEKMISTKRGNYEDAKRSFNGISSSRVRNLPEFAGRYSAMQQKLTAWNLEVNPKQPPVVVPNNPPGTPKNNGKTTDKNAKPLEEDNEIERKGYMLSYFPDTLTVDNDFLAYVEINKNNTVQLGSHSGNVNSTYDSLVISYSAIKSAVVNSLVSVQLGIDGGNQNFTINPRFDNKTKTVTDGSPARWEWMIHPNAEGEFRLRLSVTYQKQNKDGVTQEMPAISKVFVVKGLRKKGSDNFATSNWIWILLGLIILLVLIGYLMSKSKRNKNERNRTERDRIERERIERDRAEQTRINNEHRNDLDNRK